MEDRWEASQGSDLLDDLESRVQSLELSMSVQGSRIEGALALIEDELRGLKRDGASRGENGGVTVKVFKEALHEHTAALSQQLVEMSETVRASVLATVDARLEAASAQRDEMSGDTLAQAWGMPAQLEDLEKSLQQLRIECEEWMKRYPSSARSQSVDTLQALETRMGVLEAQWAAGNDMRDVVRELTRVLWAQMGTWQECGGFPETYGNPGKPNEEQKHSERNVRGRRSRSYFPQHFSL